MLPPRCTAPSRVLHVHASAAGISVPSYLGISRSPDSSALLPPRCTCTPQVPPEAAPAQDVEAPPAPMLGAIPPFDLVSMFGPNEQTQAPPEPFEPLFIPYSYSSCPYARRHRALRPGERQCWVLGVWPMCALVPRGPLAPGVNLEPPLPTCIPQSNLQKEMKLESKLDVQE